MNARNEFRRFVGENFDQHRPPADQPNQLPKFISAADISSENSKTPPVLIEGLLHRGSKALIAGESKARKSWLFIDLALAVATGTEWLGYQTHQSKVLYLNFELLAPFFHQRVVAVAKSRKQALAPDFHIWNLRNVCYDLRVLTPIIKSELPGVGLMIVDPIYKALGDLDENNARDIGQLMRAVEDLSHATGAAVVFGSHFAKGNQAGKSAKDRPSGSGVFVRDPDLVMTMTRHAEDNCVVMSSEPRYTAPIPDYVLRWSFPVFNREDGLDPLDLHEPGKRSQERNKERLPSIDDDGVLRCLPATGLQDPSWRHYVFQQYGVAGQSYFSAKERLIKAGRVERRGDFYFPVRP